MRKLGSFRKKQLLAVGWVELGSFRIFWFLGWIEAGGGYPASGTGALCNALCALWPPTVPRVKCVDARLRRAMILFGHGLLLPLFPVLLYP